MSRVFSRNILEYTEENSFLNETLFHNANGYIGVRGSLCEGVPAGWDTMRGTYINGFYDIVPMNQAENLCNFVTEKEVMINVADTMTIRCEIDGAPLDLMTGKIIEHTRILDMDRGITVRKLIWESPEGKQIRLDVQRMTSFEQRSLFLVDYRISALNFDGNIKLISLHKTGVENYSNPDDPRLASESRKNILLQDWGIEDDSSVAVSETSASGLKLCSAVCNIVDWGNDPATADLTIDGSTASYISQGELRKGESVRLTKYSVFCDSRRDADVKSAALRDMKRAKAQGTEYFYKAQEDFLNEFWRHCDMDILGDDALNEAVRFNMYQLLQSSASDDKCSIAAKGLSGEGYEGHYFWDSETFILPFFIMTNPQIAKTVLEYRYSTLNKARENAGLMGHTQGVLFPWRTITGTECSGYYVSGSAAYHINADIAYAVVKYFQVTDDRKFIEDKGLELLIETARLWLDVGCYNSDGAFVINQVTGPDEYTCLINNNYYTNCAARFNMRWAVKLYRELESAGQIDRLRERLHVTEEELCEMNRAADAMLLLYDETLGINPQDDSFLSKPIWDLENTPKANFPLLLHYHPLHLYRHQVCKQADTVLAYFMFENEQSRDVMERGFRYYEKVTAHDSSLSSCVFSIVASRLGLVDEAYMYFDDSAKMDLENTHGNTKHGIHTANMGGCYMAIVNGFARVTIDENGLSAAPVLPREWQGLRFNMMYRGSLIRLEITENATSVELLEGNPIEITLYGSKYNLDAGTIKVNY